MYIYIHIFIYIYIFKLHLYLFIDHKPFQGHTSSLRSREISAQGPQGSALLEAAQPSRRCHWATGGARHTSAFQRGYIPIYLLMYIYIYVCMYVCMYIFIRIYIYIHVYIYISLYPYTICQNGIGDCSSVYIALMVPNTLYWASLPQALMAYMRRKHLPKESM